MDIVRAYSTGFHLQRVRLLRAPGCTNRNSFRQSPETDSSDLLPITLIVMAPGLSVRDTCQGMTVPDLINMYEHP